MTEKLNVMLVGEAWGAREEQVGHPLVGASGIELTRLLGEAKLAPYVTVWCSNCRRETLYYSGSCLNCSFRVYPKELDLVAHWKMLRRDFGIGVTNVFNRRPIGNNLELFFSPDGKRDFPGMRIKNRMLRVQDEHWHEIQRLWGELEATRPNVTVAMGNCACWALLGNTRITVLRGTIQHAVYPDKTLKVLPTYHPAAILRQWSLRTIGLADFIKAERESQYPEIQRIPRWITINPTLAEIRAWANRGADLYAVDIETFRKQISMIGFARSANDAIIIPFHKPDRSSYWPTEEEEFQAWRLAERILSSPVPKVFQNGLYDLAYIMRMGLRVRAAHKDTMLRHHSMFPELPKSLGFLGSLYCDEIAWKTMREGETLKRDE